MKNVQPNFEALKSLFYRAFYGKIEVEMNILFEQISAKMFLPSFSNRLKEFKSDFNKWLDGVDIRQASVLIDILKENKASVPAWMVNRKFTIDYNKYGMLDILRLEYNEA